MGHTLLTEFKFRIDRHTIRATNDLAQCLLGIRDESGQQVIKAAERVRNYQAAILMPNSPYALIYVGPQRVIKMTDRGVVVEREAEIVISLVFSMPPREDYLAYSDGLQDLVWNALAPQTADNPSGHIWSYPAGWRFSSDTDFRMIFDRGVRQIDGSKLELSGSLYSVPIQFKIRIFPNTPLS